MTQTSGLDGILNPKGTAERQGGGTVLEQGLEPFAPMESSMRSLAVRK